MTKIKLYPQDTDVTDYDIVIGSDAENSLVTKNYSMIDIRNYIVDGLSPIVGGTLKINEIVYEGVATSPADVVNDFIPSYNVAQYEVLILSVNGILYMLKLQDVSLGYNETPVTDADFIEFPVSVGPTGPTGPTGPIGATGPTGPPGPDGVSITSDGVTTTVTGDGSPGDPYIVEVENLQKTISSFPHTLTTSDDKNTIFINNGVSNVYINIVNPHLLPANFSCLFVQLGTGTVNFNASVGNSLLYPVELLPIIKGQYYWSFIEKDKATSNFYLMGSLAIAP